MKVLMFHSIGNGDTEWARSFLSVNPVHFEYFCAYLSANNYRSLHLNEWYKLQNDKAKINNKHIVLTFDDGYLDNWVFAYPIMKKYGLKGTVFINPEFVDHSSDKRKNLENVNFDHDRLQSFDKLGFLNWLEIQEMDRSSVMNAQSHSMSHNWYFKSDKIVDIYTGQNNYDWLAWIEKPKRKPFYMIEDQKKFIPYGAPVFENDRALSIRRYFPDDRLIREAVSMYSDYAGNGALSHENKSKIMSRLKSLVQSNYPGSFETDGEMKKRYWYELSESKRILEEKLDKRIDFLCWPGGGYNDLAVELSMEAGYIASTLSSKDTNPCILNDNLYKRIPRVGMGSFIYKGNKIIPSKLKKHLVYSYNAANCDFLSKVVLKIQKYLI